MTILVRERRGNADCGRKPATKNPGGWAGVGEAGRGGRGVQGMTRTMPARSMSGFRSFARLAATILSHLFGDW